MNQQNSKTSRRKFLSTTANAAATMGLLTLAPAMSVSATDLKSLNDNTPEGSEEWFNQFKGKHKIVYDATETHQAMPLAWSWVFMNTNNETGTPDSALSTLVILRHNAICMGLENRLWEKYNFGETYEQTDPKTKAPSKRNFYYNAQEGDLMVPDWSIEKLQKRGVKFAICNMAIYVMSMFKAKEMGLDHETVRKDYISGILPDIKLVPSGVWALSRAQEHGMAYCFAG